MKKLSVILCTMLILPAFAVDDFGISVPQWKDFAPKAFVDVKKPNFFSKVNVVADYWYQRRMAFETELERCSQLQANDDRFNCYENLKVEQFKENSVYNAKIEARHQANGGIPEMRNMTDNMLPINSSINTFTRMQASEY